MTFLNTPYTSPNNHIEPVYNKPILDLPSLVEALYAHISRQKKQFSRINLDYCKHILALYQGDDRVGKVTFSAQHYTRYAVSMPSYAKDFDLYII
jgi:hypothetical protein